MGTTDRQRDEVAAGIKFTLMAGDFAVFPPNTPGEVRNDGTGPTVALVAVVEPFGNEAAPVATPPAQMTANRVPGGRPSQARLSGSFSGRFASSHALPSQLKMGTLDLRTALPRQTRNPAARKEPSAAMGSREADFVPSRP